MCAGRTGLSPYKSLARVIRVYVHTGAARRSAFVRAREPTDGLSPRPSETFLCGRQGPNKTDVVAHPWVFDSRICNPPRGETIYGVAVIRGTPEEKGFVVSSPNGLVTDNNHRALRTVYTRPRPVDNGSCRRDPAAVSPHTPVAV